MKSHLLENLFQEFNQIDETRNLSSLSKSYMVINYTYREKSYSYIDAITHMASFVVQMIKSLIQFSTKPKVKAEFPILTFMSARPHLFKMNDLIAAELNESCTRAIFYKDDSALRSNQINFKSLNYGLIKFLSVSHFRTIVKALKSFKSFINASGLPPSHLPPFAIHLLRQFWAYSSFKDFFVSNRVPYLICEYDQYNDIAALVLAAKEQGIPTYTQTHGLLNSQFAYTPLVAENIFVWGQYHKELLKLWGVDEANIHVTGAVQYQRVEDLNSKRHTLLKSYGLRPRVISLATNPMQPAVQAALISFVESLVPIMPKEWSLVLRPHPSEQMQTYQARLESIGVNVFDNSLMPIQDLLGLSDCVMVWNSAFAVDALVNKIPTVHIDLNDIESEGEVIRLVAENLIPSFSKPSELVEYFKLFNSQSPERFCMQTEDYERFKQVYCVATGQDAAKNITRHLSQHINQNDNE